MKAKLAILTIAALFLIAAVPSASAYDLASRCDPDGSGGFNCGKFTVLDGNGLQCTYTWHGSNADADWNDSGESRASQACIG